MTYDPTLWRTKYPTKLEVQVNQTGEFQDWGAYDVDGADLSVEGKTVDIVPGQSTNVAKRIITGRSGTFEAKVLEMTPEKLAIVLNTKTAYAGNVLTADTNRSIGRHNFKVTLGLSDGSSWLIEFAAEFDPSVAFKFKVDDTGAMPIKVNLICDETADDKILTLTNTPAA